MLSGTRPLTATSGKELEFDQVKVLAVPQTQFLSPYWLHKVGVFFSYKTAKYTKNQLLQMLVPLRCAELVFLAGAVISSAKGLTGKAHKQEFEKPQQAWLAALPVCQLHSSHISVLLGKEE